MINLFNKIRKFLKFWLTYFYYNIIYFTKTSKNFTTKKGTYAIVNTDEHFKFDKGRYFSILCLYLDHAGFSVIIKTSYKDYQKKRPLLKQKYFFVRNCSTPLNTVVLAKPDSKPQTIHLSYGFDILKTGLFDFISPYPMSPSQYKYYPATMSGAIEKSFRTMKILFAGNADPTSYPNRRVVIYFDVIPRRRVIDFILQLQNTRKLQEDPGRILLKELLYSKDYLNEVIISEVKIEEEHWLKILGKADFFICPPGVDMPWCHNCVEAMSAGAIPILQYSKLFHPHLENHINCLSFTTEAELQKAIEIALAMEASEIEKMRKNVLSYFDDYLSINRIAEKLKTFSESSEQELNVAIPFIPSKSEWSVLKGIRS